MTEMLKTITSFLAGFGVPVYAENSVPKDAVLPYVTFSPVQMPWDQPGIMPVRVWTRSTSLQPVAEIVDKISDAIGDGISIPAGGGYIYLYKENPWAQMQPMQGTEMKLAYINIGIYTMIPEKG